MRRIGWLAALAVLVGVGVWGWRLSQELGRTPTLADVQLALGLTEPAPAARPGGGGGGGGAATPVETAQARRGSIALEISAVGSLRSNESVVLRPEIAGRVAEIRFREGERVAAGAALIKLDDTTAQAEMAQAKANLALSTSNYERQRELLRGGASSERARDEAQARFRVDEANVQLQAARLAKYLISAPFDGVIGLRRISPGDFVSAGAEIVNLEQIDPIKVDFRVPEIHLGRLAVGQTVRIEIDAFPGARFDGAVYAIDPLVDANGRAVVIRARIANPDAKLRPGLFARVTLVADARHDVVLAPEDAIVPAARGFSVFVVADGKAKSVPVELGLRRGGEVEIRKGLAGGELLVVAGQARPTLRDGATVRVIPSRPPAAAAPGSEPRPQG